MASDGEGAKRKMIDAVVADIERRFGKGSIMKLGDKKKVNADVIPTGALSLDVALGIGGIPKGRIVEIYGPESSGKTTLALHIIAEAQKRGGVCAFIDAEHALDPTYAGRIGVQLKDLYISQPDYGEQALEIAEALTRSGGMDIIVIDSVAALTPKAEIDGEMGDMQIGLQARLMSQALRKITGVASKTGTAIIFLNQIRMKIGMFVGNPETTSGGRALKFYASVRIDIRQRDKIMKDGEVKGHVREAKIVKNKLAPPFRKARFSIIYPTGIDKISSIVDVAVKYGVIKRKGAYFYLSESDSVQGLDRLTERLKSDDKLTEKIVKAVLKQIE